MNPDIFRCIRCPLHLQNPPECFPLQMYGQGKIMVVQSKPSRDDLLAEQPHDQGYDLVAKIMKELGIKNFVWTYAVRCLGKPRKNHAEICRDWLKQEIYLIKPRFLFLLGKECAYYVLGSKYEIKSATSLESIMNTEYDFEGVKTVVNYPAFWVCNQGRGIYEEFKEIFSRNLIKPQEI